MAMAQTAFRTRPAFYRHSTAVARRMQRAKMPLFQAFLCPSFAKVTDGLCIKDATTIDYSNGTGNNTIKVYVNITPEDVFWLYNALTSHTANFEMEQTKIFGLPDQNGYSQMTKLRIVRAEFDKNGTARRYPWCISAENGVGIAQHTQVGGTYCKSGSYQTVLKAFISLNDYDFFRLINRAVRYITQFENTYCPPIIGNGRNAYGQMMMQRQAAYNSTQNY